MRQGHNGPMTTPALAAAAPASLRSPLPVLRQALEQIPADERALCGRLLVAGAVSMPVALGLSALAPCSTEVLSALTFGLFAVRAYRK